MDISKGFTIAQFQQNILKKTGGISASNLYAFQISNPDETKGYTLAKHFKDNLEEATGITSNDLVNYQLNMLCNEIQVPGVTMSAADYKMGKKGITQKMASAKVFNELDVSFFCDADSLPYKFLSLIHISEPTRPY